MSFKRLFSTKYSSIAKPNSFILLRKYKLYKTKYDNLKDSII